jgi:hypothetical protein
MPAEHAPGHVISRHVRRPYGPKTIREVSQQIITWEDFRVHFYSWLDDYYQFPSERERMIRDEIVPLFDRRISAFLAAAVHQLCMIDGLPVPPWVYHDPYYLPEPWFYPPELSIRAIQIVESLGAFRDRNIFVFANTLERV